MNLLRIIILMLSLHGSVLLASEEKSDDKLTLETSFIKGNKELPNVLYIVPWRTLEQQTTQPDVIVLHSLFGDIFEPETGASLKQIQKKD